MESGKCRTNYLEESEGGYDYSRANTAIDAIVEDLSPKMVIVFGSVAKGTANQDSDLDLLIVMDFDKRRVDIIGDIHVCLWRKGIILEKDIVVITPYEYEEKRGDEHSFIHEIIATGIVVYKG